MDFALMFISGYSSVLTSVSTVFAEISLHTLIKFSSDLDSSGIVFLVS